MTTFLQVIVWTVATIVGVHNYRQLRAEDRLPCRWTIAPWSPAARGVYDYATHTYYKPTATPAVFCFHRTTFPGE